MALGSRALGLESKGPLSGPRLLRMGKPSPVVPPTLSSFPPFPLGERTERSKTQRKHTDRLVKHSPHTCSRWSGWTHTANLTTGSLYYHSESRAGLCSRDVMLPGRIADLFKTLTRPAPSINDFLVPDKEKAVVVSRPPCARICRVWRLYGLKHCYCVWSLQHCYSSIFWLRILT